MIEADFDDGFGNDFGEDLTDQDLVGGWDDEPVEPPPARNRYHEEEYEDEQYEQYEEPQNKRQRGRRGRPARTQTRTRRRARPTRPPPVYEQPVTDGFADPFSGVSGQVADMAINQATRHVTSFVSQHSFMSFDYYRPLFAVSDQYVSRKLLHILLPVLQKDWKRKLESRSGQKRYKLPREDNNAPDGYIVLMAFITFVIVVSISVGLHDKDSFSPDLMGAKISSVLGMMFLETVVMKGFYYFIDISETGPGWLEQFCYSGYKLVLVILNIIVYLFSKSLNGYRFIALLTGLSAAYFMVQTLKPYFEMKDANAKPFLAFVTALEVFLVFLLGSLAATADPSAIIPAVVETSTTTTTTILDATT
jgi:hypothetical protein